MNLNHIQREFAPMRVTFLRASLVAFGLIVGMSACKDDDTKTGVDAGGKAFIRYVNGVFQQDTVHRSFADSIPCVPGPAEPTCNPVSSKKPHTFRDTLSTYTPISVDVLIDSSGSPPGVTGLAPLSVSTGTEGLVDESGFFELEPGVHSFVARRGDITNGPSFFVGPTGSNETSCAPAQYLPRQQMTGTTFYTMNLAGVNPATSTNSAGNVINDLAVIKPPSDGCELIFTPSSLSSVEDPFSPPWNTESGAEKYQARFFFWHAAPFMGTKTPLDVSSGNRTKAARIYVTTDRPADMDAILNLQYWDNVSWQNKGQAQNIAAGTYWITVVAYIGTTNQPIMLQEQVTFEEGEVLTFFIMNKLPPGQTAIRWTPSSVGGPLPDFPDGATDYSDYFKLVKLKMNQFSF